MKKSFWRIHISNPAEKYDYMCGGTLDNLTEQLIKEENKYISTSFVTGLIRFMSIGTSSPPEIGLVYEKELDNGVHLGVYYAGEVEQED